MRNVINRINEVDFNDLAERKHFGEIYEQLHNDLQSASNAGECHTPRAITAFMAERNEKPADEAKLQAGLRAVEKKELPHMLSLTSNVAARGKPVSDSIVITEVQEHWHPNKARLSPLLLQTWLDWLRCHDLVPKRRGPSTRHQAELI